MAFPTTGVLDSFTGTDGTTPPNANWSQAVEDTTINGLKIISNSVYSQNATGLGSDYWNPGTFGPDAEVFVTVSTLMLSGENLRLYLRVANPGTVATFSGYRMVYIHNTGWHIQRVDNSVVTTLIGPVATNFLAAGNKVGFEAKGTVLTAYRWNGTSWVSVTSYDTASDGTKYSGAGFIALTADHQTVRLDDFGGGTVVGTVPSGGTVTVTGTAKVGQTLTATNSGWTNTPTGYQYVWQHADDSGFTTNVTSIQTDNLAGTTDTYTVASADDTKYIRCQVVASNASGNSTAANSSATAQVTYAAPVFTTNPVISGSPVVGQAISVTPGTTNPA